MKTEFRLYNDADFADLKRMVFALYREDPEGEGFVISENTHLLRRPYSCERHGSK